MKPKSMTATPTASRSIAQAPPGAAGPATAAVPTPSAAAVAFSSEANGRVAFATWTGVVSLGQTYRMTEADKAYWRAKWEQRAE